MDVDATTFPHDLLDMLVAISEADFVSFDLELSGIPSRLPGRPRNAGRQMLEERYLEAKQGAEKHQILQVGFTCARYDYIKSCYVLRPYNVNISPLVEERLDIEREFSFQAGAIAFLLKSGFQFDAPFRSGVQYLSRDEARQAKRSAYDRIDNKKVFEDLQLKETDIESLDFLDRVRAQITQWQAGRDASPLIITTHTGMDKQPNEPAITRFEKRLVYQLLRAEYPELKVIGRADCIKIIPFNVDREEENQRRMKSRVKEQIARQTGFRWVVEALAGGRIDGLELGYFARSRLGHQIAADFDNIRNRLNKAAMGLKSQQPVLVGHNMFTDLVYLYRTFIGELPETLQKFCNKLHELFPRIVDTKYLATHDGGDLNASPTLQAIDDSLSMQKLPVITIHQDHRKYDNMEAFHEAGYDSLLTAKIMLRLATKVDHQEKLDRGDSAVADAIASPRGTSLERGSMASVVAPPAPSADLRSFTNKIAGTPGLPLQSPSNHHHTTQVRAVELNGHNDVRKPFQGGKLIVQEITDVLQGVHFGPNQIRDITQNKFGERRDGMDSGNEVGRLPWGTVSSESGHSKVYDLEPLQWSPMEVLPMFDSDFWTRFGNRLRIFGTQETVLHIADWENPIERNRVSASTISW